ncbi:MAG: Glycosyl transferase family 2 [Syntrophaceae bacterium PtaU1.Bin231]|nr:MAG: Glycosyl transferase family 2 [Syntrophaceae bacterium PtaU1.Bin231]
MVAATGRQEPVQAPTMEEKIPLSVAIITKNEAANLPGCLQSIAFARQIVVVDSGSDDGTLEIARGFGCEVFPEPWKGFGAQKQAAIDRCREPWVLVLDADERIPPETQAAIRAVIAAGEGAAPGYSFPRKNFFQGRWIRHMGWWPDRITRLFRRGRGRMTQAPVHEAVEVTGAVEALEAPIEHYTEGRLSEILKKIDRYSTLAAEEAFREGRRSSVWGALARAEITFLQNYVLRRGFLDGRQGLVLSVTDAVNKFFKYAKLSELNRRKEGSEEERKG